ILQQRGVSGRGTAAAGAGTSRLPQPLWAPGGVCFGALPGAPHTCDRFASLWCGDLAVDPAARDAMPATRGFALLAASFALNAQFCNLLLIPDTTLNLAVLPSRTV